MSSGPANYPGKGVSLLAFASARADGGCGANRHPLRHIDVGSLIAFPKRYWFVSRSMAQDDCQKQQGKARGHILSDWRRRSERE